MQISQCTHAALSAPFLFAALISYRYYNYISENPRLFLASVAEQAGLDLTGLHIPMKDRFSHDLPHMCPDKENLNEGIAARQHTCIFILPSRLHGNVFMKKKCLI